MSRRRRPAKPATLSATAMPQSHSSGSADTVPPGSLQAAGHGYLAAWQARPGVPAGRGVSFALPMTAGWRKVPGAFPGPGGDVEQVR